ncbi:MAG: hypothetical protein JO170_31040, partial [Verrucomicrobia bacterium]|nr:hypothetical protein [Verrucomicrobiota bacterium]
LAGRRIDAPETEPPRFPLKNAPIVRERIATFLSTEHAETLVCSAACGADLIALEEAERLGLRRRIILPFPSKRFRELSVSDRPGNWGPVFDRLVAAAEATGDLVIVPTVGDDDHSAYAAANQAIIRETEALAKDTPCGEVLRRVSVIVWEVAATSGTDISGALGTLAAQAGFEQRYLLTQ